MTDKMKLTCMLRRKPAWLKELKLKAIVMKTDACTGVLTKFKQSNDTPGPMKPIDCCSKSYISIVIDQRISCRLLYLEGTCKHILIT